MDVVLPRLENWSVVSTDMADPFCPPECRRLRISGEVYGYPNKTDGHPITTSNILSVDGNKVTCLSRTYVLGKPAAAYVEWCAQNGHHIPTDEVPIKWSDSDEATT